MALNTDDFRRDQREADRIDRRRGELFRSMIQSEAWKEYIKLVEAKIQDFSDELLKAAGSLDGLIRSEFIKGAMGGLIMARDIASVSIATADALRRDTQAEDNDDE